MGFKRTEIHEVDTKAMIGVFKSLLFPLVA